MLDPLEDQANALLEAAGRDADRPHLNRRQLEYRRRRELALLEDVDRPAPDPAAEALAAALASQLLRAAGLTREERAVWVLCREHPGEAVAVALGLSAATVRRRRASARGKLQAAWGALGLGVP
jgi:DNA-directed RNA polymerase specialized sigma24 family protein